MLLSLGIGFFFVRHAGQGLKAKELGLYGVLTFFFVLMILRRGLGLRGKRHAQWVAFGFLLLLLTNVLGSHGFKL